MTRRPRADDPRADPELMPLLKRAAAGDPHVLDLTYLPQIDLASGEVVGVDVKLRMVDLRRGLLAPARFWPAAHTADLVSALAHQALRRCAREVRITDRRRGADLRVWVPLPGALVPDPSLLVLVEELAAEAAPRALVLQFGEAGLDTIPDLDLRLAALRRAGVAVGILTDDAPRSRQSLEGGLGVDALRLSPRLVRAVAPLARDDVAGEVESSIAGLIECAHRRGLVVAASAVDSWEVSAGLCELGCDRASGYLYSPPVSKASVNGLLEGHTSWLGREDGATLMRRPRSVRPQ